MKLDNNSRDIRRELQRDATLLAKERADKLAMSQTTVWRRMQELEADGVITARGAALDPDRLGLQVCTMIEVRIKSQDSNCRNDFERFVIDNDNVIQCF